jgi:CheY-like chemotaxis protein
MVAKEIFILLVEDHSLIRRMTVLLLEQLNCKVDAAETGTLALEYANKNKYDIIFMDIGLPDIDGLSIIRRIRESSGINRDAPIIALTANSDRGYIQESFEAGATDYLVKPLYNIIANQVLERFAG